MSQGEIVYIASLVMIALPLVFLNILEAEEARTTHDQLNVNKVKHPSVVVALAGGIWNRFHPRH